MTVVHMICVCYKTSSEVVPKILWGKKIELVYVFVFIQNFDIPESKSGMHAMMSVCLHTISIYAIRRQRWNYKNPTFSGICRQAGRFSFVKVNVI